MKNALLVILGFVLLCCALLFSPGAGVLHYAFAPLACLTAYLVMRLSPAAYITLTLWLYFVTPVIRRLVDYRSSYLDPSPILLAPLLATGLAVFPVIRRVRALWTVDYLPFWLAMAATLYGAVAGLFLNPGMDLARNLILWLVPIIWGIYLMDLSQDKETVRKLVSTNFKWAWILLGIYGIVQYLAIPAWDQLWLEYVIKERNSLSFGNLATGEVRIWSTFNGPAIFATFQMAFLITCVAETGVLGLVALVAGGLPFLLAQVRATWIGASVAFLCLLVLQPGRRAKLVAVLMVAAFLVAGLATLPHFQDTIVTRLQTLTTGENDGSFQERKATQERLINLVAESPFGLGLAPSVGKQTQEYPIDSGIFMALLSLGWVGAFVLWGALGALAINSFQGFTQVSPLCTGFRALFIASLIQLPFADMYSGASGFILWTAVALAEIPTISIAHRRVNAVQQNALA